MSDDAELLRVLAGLRARYLAEAPARMDDVRQALAGIRTGDTAALGELRQLLHRLAGTGGSYGLQDVTDAARAGEQAVHAIQQRGTAPTPAEIADLAAHVQRVAEAFRGAGAST
jgi:chemotaxis protein histidine kinase CheA